MCGNKENGFSLLEVMVALTILSIGLLAMASFFDTGHRLLRISDQTTLAAQLAQNKMAALCAAHPKKEESKEEVAGTGMTRRWSILPSKNDPKLWVITVEVFPTQEPTRSVLLKSLLFY